MNIKEYIQNHAGIGKSFNTAKIIIIGPYPTGDFLQQVLHHTPKEVILIVDDGWPEERIREIRNLFTAKRRRLVVRRVAPQTGSGLVHAKLYYFEWINGKKNRRRRSLLAGSANASIQGFGIHAESFVSIEFADLPRCDRDGVIRYFEALEGGENVNMTSLNIGNKSWITLPALRIVEAQLTNGFDTWLRRGRLCHKYQPDPAFGQLILRLKAPMPKSELEEHLGRSGFGISGDSKSFTRPYVVYEAGTEDTEKQTWRQRFFIETDYGFWTSGECFAVLKDDFVASKNEGREVAIDKIREADEKDYDQWLGTFTNSLEAVVERISNPVNIADYFQVKSDGTLDLKKYQGAASAKLTADRCKANDDYFTQRFVAGFAFPPVPQFGDEFAVFATSFCDNLLSRMNGRKVQNRLAQVVRELVEDEDNYPASGSELYSYLCRNWVEIREDVMEFHRKD